jgi:hypothetical protein
VTQRLFDYEEQPGFLARIPSGKANLNVYKGYQSHQYWVNESPGKLNPCQDRFRLSI